MNRIFHHGLVLLANALQRWFLRHPLFYKALFADPLSGARWRVGAWRAWVNFQQAYRTVPAYRDFVDAHGGPPALRYRDGLPDLAVLPETDKVTYVQRYDHEARCVGGRLPRRGVVVDESSGSSGRATSWVRGPEERWATKQMLQLSFRNAMGDQPCFVINAFALGAWATGLNVSLSLSDICIMKSTGPDLDKIVHTLQEFGPGYDYVVTGYPPFLKTLGDDRRIDWGEFRVRAIFGGEAMSEPMRRYLLRSFTQVVGSYGASDLEINMAAESPFTIRLRQEMERNPTLRERLTQTGHGALPMVLQYNPLVYHLEANPKGELLVTLTRPSNIAPKIRYNIHDLGHVARYENVATVLAELGLTHLIAETQPIRLPLLFIYGRSDLSIDYYGANVTPDSVGEILIGLDELAPHLDSFRLISREDQHHDKTLEVAIALREGCDPADLPGPGIAQQLFAQLGKVNGDFRNAYCNTATQAQLPRVTLHATGTGPFAGENRIKHSYVDRVPYHQAATAGAHDAGQLFGRR
ncbi:MAG: hypothetical protein WD080_00010 [Egibacteraceae bacterium]